MSGALKDAEYTPSEKVGRMTDIDRRTGEIPASAAGNRLDQALAAMFPDLSRTRLRTWIDAGLVEVDGEIRRPRDRVVGGERVVVRAVIEADTEVGPEPIPLEVVYEDEDLLVVDKPPGLVVHPGAGNASGTLQNALVNYDPELARLPRAGIVHRLDKDTGGLMVIARSLRAHTALVEAIAERNVTRQYAAICRGRIVSGGTIDAPIGRHRVDRIRMAVVDGGKPAVTHYRVSERFEAHTLIEATLESGRTHQIRVHMAHAGHPLLGDPLYGGRPVVPLQASDALRMAINGFRRQALHAVRLALRHPSTDAEMEWQSSLPRDMNALLTLLRTG